MAITDTATDITADEQALAEPTGLALAAPAGLAGVIGSGDHTTIGRLWVGSAGLIGAASFGLAAWSGIAAIGDTAARPEGPSGTLTLALFGLVLGFAVPLFVGLATAVVPLQVGASTVAFPRAAAAAFWAWLTSAALLAVSYLPALGGGVGGDKVDGSVLTYLAIVGLVASLLLGAVCVMTTVVTLRSPGMGLDRVPLFSWSMLVAGGIWLLTLPILAANAVLIVVDLKYGSPSLFGARDQQWAQLAWIVLPPQVFAWAIPALGVAGDAAVTFARGDATPRQPQRGVLLGAVGVAGALSFGAYVQPAVDPFAFRQWAYIAQVAVLVLPLLTVAGGFATALRKGATVRGPLVLGIVSLLLLVLGALASVLFVVGPLDLQETDADLLRGVPALGPSTTGLPVYTWGVLFIVLVAAGAGAAAGLFHWASKLTGRQLPDGIGLLLGAVFAISALLAGGPLLVLGFATKSDPLADAGQALIGTSVAGLALALLSLIAAVALTLAARAAVLRGADRVEADPWGSGATLEWATDSPPVRGNFARPFEVASAEPLLDASEGGA